MKLKFLIPSLMAAGFIPANSHALPLPARKDKEVKSPSLFDVFKLEHKYTLAAHRSHSSHGSHGSHSSHRSSSGGSYVRPAPSPAPSPSPRLYDSTPPQQVLPQVPSAPRTLPGNSPKFMQIVLQVQICLMLFGYDLGAIDGRVGPETAAAIAKFQEQWGFKITGTITPEVLDACGIAAK